jgi:two-component system chemotaxis sensor kinase CheA
MSYDLDEDILQDFLIEAGEILDLLSEQLVELENNPQDKDLLNAIFRGFHTVKGGAGFLSLAELVDTCHGAENVFDVLRNGQRSVTSSLMDTMLKALDTVNTQFQAVQEREVPEAADPTLLAELHRLCKPEAEDEAVTSAIEEPVTPSAPVTPEPEPVVGSSIGSVDEITQDEFEKLLDELHGKGSAPGVSKPEPSKSMQADSAVSDSGDITDDEFEKLLDELHGVGKSPSSSTSAPAEPPEAPEPVAPVSSSPSTESDSDLMTDEEFEKLLDELHGTGKGPSVEELDMATKPVSANAAPEVPKEPTTPTPQPTAKPVAVKEEAKASAPVVKKPQAEATVRVDTSTLDTIMNMVGELVLVRNRLLSLGLNSNDEEMSKAVSNLDVVTADLQGAVMKTRMQPIKKVFGRFPRVVRDLARNLNKDIVLEMRGEETDLDKNLVEALADPLIHLVRNSVDHGIEMPDDRVKAGKSRTGKVILSASQEGDHIELSIVDDGGGMDPNKLRGIAVKRGMMDEDAAGRLTDKECFNLIFAPGFSSKDKISDISGRGVGMDVVKTAINTLNG